MAATRTPEHVDALVKGFLFGIEVFGCSQDGHEKVAWRVCETRPDADVFDGEMWDRTAADLASERINGKPVPLWWALRGARDPKWAHLYGKEV